MGYYRLLLGYRHSGRALGAGRVRGRATRVGPLLSCQRTMSGFSGWRLQAEARLKIGQATKATWGKHEKKRSTWILLDSAGFPGFFTWTQPRRTWTQPGRRSWSDGVMG